MSTDRPGFADPVGGAQACFRAVLQAMAQPGHMITVGDLDAPSPLDPATGAVLLTLVDADTPFWIDPALAAAASWLAFHCGAPPAPPAAASFAVALGLPDLTWFNAGSHEAPEQGATLVVQLAALGQGPAWRLRGPGIDGEATLHATGLPADVATIWARNAALFPRGIDLVLCAGRRLAALPRSVRIG